MRPSARWGWVFVLLPRLISSEPSEVVANGVKDACELARCVRSLAACPTEREGGVFAGRLRTHRDSEAASLGTRRCYMRLNRAAEGLGLETCDEAAGTQHRGSCEAGAGAGEAAHIIALVPGEG